MRLTQEEVRHVAELAKLHLSDAEVEQFAEQLSDILDFAAKIQEVDTSSIAPTPYPLPLTNVMREDQVGDCLTNEEALANAPDSDNGFYRVRAVFGE